MRIFVEYVCYFVCWYACLFFVGVFVSFLLNMFVVFIRDQWFGGSIISHNDDLLGWLWNNCYDDLGAQLRQPPNHGSLTISIYYGDTEILNRCGNRYRYTVWYTVGLDIICISYTVLYFDKIFALRWFSVFFWGSKGVPW